jgi:tRNA pseudouridine38-40 synthase
MPTDQSRPAADSPRRVVRMAVEYDGTRFVGWQRQPNGVSVQEVLEDALSAHLRERIRVTASGRTDAGVHARGQVVSFRTASRLPVRAVWRGILPLLPDDVAVTDAQDAPPGFDARRSACLRWYRYFLLNRNVQPAAARQFVTHVPQKLDHAGMLAAAAALAGTHDFAAFRSSSCTAGRTRLSMHPPQIVFLPDGFITMDFRCRSFLQNMVRIMAGAIVACGRGQMDTDAVRAMLCGGERNRHAVTLPPAGLFLWRVYYEDEKIPLPAG